MPTKSTAPFYSAIRLVSGTYGNMRNNGGIDDTRLDNILHILIDIFFYKYAIHSKITIKSFVQQSKSILVKHILNNGLWERKLDFPKLDFPKYAW